MWVGYSCPALFNLQGNILPAKSKSVDNLRSRILAAIRKIPRGKVSTYGAIGRAAGLPNGARLVARTLKGAFDLPWQRVLGAGGEIKLRGDSALEQRFRLQAEGITFRGRKVDMKKHEFRFVKQKQKKTRRQTK